MLYTRLAPQASILALHLRLLALEHLPSSLTDPQAWLLLVVQVPVLTPQWVQNVHIPHGHAESAKASLVSSLYFTSSVQYKHDEAHHDHLLLCRSGPGHASR